MYDVIHIYQKINACIGFGVLFMVIHNCTNINTFMNQ